MSGKHPILFFFVKHYSGLKRLIYLLTDHNTQAQTPHSYKQLNAAQYFPPRDISDLLPWACSLL